MQVGSGVGCVVLCCVVLYCESPLCLVSSFGSDYGVLIQCVPLVCRSLSAFLLSVCMSAWSMSSICMSPIVCCLFLKWYVDSREVLHFTSAFIFFRSCV